MSGMGLTPKQRELLAYLKGRELCPSYDEMRCAMGLKSKSSVGRLIAGLEERGYICRLPNRARAIEVLPEGGPPELVTMVAPGDDWRKTLINLPLHGRINHGDLPSVRGRA